MLWGAIAFVVLPIVADAAWNIGSDAFDTLNDAATLGFVALGVVIFGGMGVYLLVRLADGLIRTYRGLVDLRARVTVVGDVVKHHTTDEARWFAVDPGDVDEVKACHPGDDGNAGPRRDRPHGAHAQPPPRHLGGRAVAHAATSERSELSCSRIERQAVRFVDLGGGAEAGLDRTLDPRVRERRVLAGEVDATFGRDDRLVEQRLLSGIEERERATGELVVVPHLRRAHLELVERLRVDAGDVFERLDDAVVR